MVFSVLASKLCVHTDKKGDEYYPGDMIGGYAKLHTLRGVAARSVKVRLRCIEWLNPKKNTNKEGKGQELLLWEKEKKLGGNHKYHAGEWAFNFKLPKTALPTITPEPYQKHAHVGAGLKWHLHAQLDLPHSPDMHAYKQIFIY